LCHAAWVWSVLVGCSLLLTSALLAAGGAFAARAYMELPADTYVYAAVPVSIGTGLVIAALTALAQDAGAVKPANTMAFLAKCLRG